MTSTLNYLWSGNTSWSRLKSLQQASMKPAAACRMDQEGDGPMGMQHPVLGAFREAFLSAFLTAASHTRSLKDVSLLR